jgi:hypothetical protein
MATLSPRDARAWDRLGGIVATAIESRLGPRVLANRSRVDRSGWRLAGHRPALARARRAATVLAHGARILVRTDVAAFYPSVTPSALDRALRGIGLDRSDARDSAGMVEGWGSGGYPGLPIGPDTSAVMANAVLAAADRALGPFPFLRWVDDYLIAVPSERAAHAILDRLASVLDDLGLPLNVHKTAVAEGPRLGAWLGHVSDGAIT